MDSAAVDPPAAEMPPVTKATSRRMLKSPRFYPKSSILDRSVRLMIMKTVAVATLTSITALGAYANPLNPTVVGGSATVTQSGNTLTVNQTSQRAAIDWQSFNIGAGETTRFIQPSSSAVALNRVWGPGASTIAGHLLANGHLIVVNPSGIVFTPTSFVNVAGLVATTSNITNANFMAGNMIFDQPGNPLASVVNEGSITVTDGGLAAFVAPGVRNAGTIEARLGKVSLASGSKFTVDLYGDGLVNLAVDAATANELGKIEHTGRIAADGGTILMTVAAAKSVVDGLINVSGVVQARRAAMQDGKIVLTGNEATVNVSGTLEASTIGLSGSEVQFGSLSLLQATSAITFGAPLPTFNDPVTSNTKFVVTDLGSSLPFSQTVTAAPSVTITNGSSSGGSIVFAGEGKISTASSGTRTVSAGTGTITFVPTPSPSVTTIAPPVTATPPSVATAPPTSIATAPPPVTAGNVQVIAPAVAAPVPPVGRESDLLLPVNTGIFAGVTVAQSMSSAPMAQPPMSAAALSFAQAPIDPFAASLRVVETGPQSGAFRDLPYFRDGLWTDASR
jgi:filamentous hemagglutinin family protein